MSLSLYIYIYMYTSYHIVQCTRGCHSANRIPIDFPRVAETDRPTTISMPYNTYNSNIITTTTSNNHTTATTTNNNHYDNKDTTLITILIPVDFPRFEETDRPTFKHIPFIT